MRKAFIVYGLFAIIVLLVACSGPSGGAPAPVVVKQTVIVPGTPQIIEKVVTPTPAPTTAPTRTPRPNALRVNSGGPGDISMLDPNLAADTASITQIENMFVGLTRLNEVDSSLQPGIATKWDISQDGRVYTFTLRSDVPWVKYDAAKKQVTKVQSCLDKEGKTKDRMVTAKDFEYGILRALHSKTASPYAYLLAFAIDGGELYNSGTLTDTNKVGVKAVNETTLQMKFGQAAAYNPSLASLWIAYATPKWLIEGDECTTARTDRWIEPGFFQSYGPYTLKEWVHNSTLTLVKNPFWPGSQEIPVAKIDQVTTVMLDPATALAEYEAGNLDYVTVPLSDMDRVKGDTKLAKQLTSAPQLCTYYFGFNTKAQYVSNANLRRALSTSLDRQKLVDTILKAGQEPAQWFGRPGAAGAPTLKDNLSLGVKFDATRAKDYLTQALKELNVTAEKLDLTLMYNTSSGNQKIAEFAQQQWKDNLGLSVKLASQELKTYLLTTRSENTPQMYRMGWCADYPDENDFVSEVAAVGGLQNPVKNGVPFGGLNWKNDKYEKLVKDAAAEMDPRKRLDLYAQAEQILVVDDSAMIPLYWYTNPQVTQPYVKRTFSASGNEFYYNWEITPEN